ncbi:hypothetical protein CEUSTIGMA_g12040.t1 [Chlamydomonas eustigma]|uniref:Thioredoxin domain-containing protein n=1 Tax=Chlamydomonas eustigma TaxID=1157962 RepID=A0A250XNU7_9CHLO|nr:hypothetical protein CEUSTIGMA_g12040.t1 [Chlamydomonas eustigma]|eukprot:GAX84619.1 hypothetical protein CEUSTIGMA_g12040.t1 [Chlamydomonas eustigma]
MSLYSIALLLIGLVISVNAHDFGSKHTVELTASNYESETSSGKVYMIAYFAPWCGHCKKLAPQWQELGEKAASQENIKISYIDCTAHRDVCQKAEVKGYPTIKIVHKNEEYKTYKGSRDVSSMYDFVVEAASELLTESS